MRKKLPKLKYELREEQYFAVERGLQLIQDQPQDWHLFTSPTGTGKSVIQLAWLDRIKDSILITPRVEIIAGMLDKAGVKTSTLAEVVERGSSYGLYTPIRLRNLLAKGEMPFHPEAVILDEAHHQNANSWQDIQMYLNGVPLLAATATPFRGTPKETQEFRKMWGTITPVTTLHDAVEKGYCAFPTVEIWPMLDDDTIDIVNGEIKISTCTDLILSKMEQVVSKCKQFYNPDVRQWDRPTMFSVPSSIAAKELVTELRKQGMPAVSVTQETKRSARVEAFELVVSCRVALVQIDVVSEGVDLPIRRLIDLKPTMSPVKWLQQIGRIMRPSEEPPEYICLCRNLERHCYLMEGLVPNSTIKTAQEAFATEENPFGFSTRSGSRAIGLEGLGKFVTTPIHLLSGITAFAYNLVNVDGFKRSEYFVLIHPTQLEPLVAQRVSTRKATQSEANYVEYDWGKWQVIGALPELKGCSSAKPGKLTPGQQRFWLSAAEKKGLNPHREVTNRSFQVLPLLRDLGVSL